MSTPFPYNPSVINALDASLSADRLASYPNATEQDKERACACYVWNTDISAALYGPLQGLDGGEVSAFRGAQRLKINRDVWRQKVGLSYRRLFRLGDESLEVVALVHRQDFERFIQSLA